MANEDTQLEYELLSENSNHVVTISGSGSRVIPLLARRPKNLTVIDVSPAQLALCELRMETMRVLSYEDFLIFWGYQPKTKWNDLRKRIFLSLPLTPEFRSMLQIHFEHNGWEAPLLDGRWEKTFVLFSKISQRFMGKRWIDGLFQCKTLPEQKAFLKVNFPTLRWKALLALVGNAKTFNALLYNGHFPKKNIPEKLTDFYQQAFEKLFQLSPARENYFLQLCFLGKIQYPEGFVFEVNPKVFEQAKLSLAVTKIKYISSDLIDWIANAKGISFVSTSDVVSYFSGDLESSFLQRMRPGLEPNARIVIRNYLRIPEGLIQTGFKDQTSKFQDQINLEKTQMYRIQVLENES